MVDLVIGIAMLAFFALGWIGHIMWLSILDMLKK